MNPTAIKDAVIVIRDLQDAVLKAHNGQLMDQVDLIVLCRRACESAFMLVQDLDLMISECETVGDTKCMKPQCPHRA